MTSNFRSITFWVPGPPHGKKDQQTTTHVRRKNKATGETELVQLKFPITHKHPETRIAERHFIAHAKAAMLRAGLDPLTGPCFVAITAVFVPPKTHQGDTWQSVKPDGPNILELVADAGSRPKKKGLAAKSKDPLVGILWDDDALLSCCLVRKVYGQSDGLLVTVCELDPKSLSLRPGDCQGATWPITGEVSGLVLGVAEQMRLDNFDAFASVGG